MSKEFLSNVHCNTAHFQKKSKQIQILRSDIQQNSKILKKILLLDLDTSISRLVKILLLDSNIDLHP
jgi:hypothetical protein